MNANPAATAAAISALVMAEQYGDSTLAASQPEWQNAAYQGDLSEMVLASIRWLANRQNQDGGFGAGDATASDPLTSLLVLSAFRLTCVPAKFSDLEPRLEAYLKKRGGVSALKKSPLDRSTLTGVLTNAALAGVISWKQTPVTRFERAAAPGWLKRLLGRPQFDQTDPVLLASGLARFHQNKPNSPLLRWVRRVSFDRCLNLIAERQANGRFGDSTATTAFVAMALSGAGKASHPIVRRAIDALLTDVSSDASWA